jgi:hypothetical protein
MHPKIRVAPSGMMLIVAIMIGGCGITPAPGPSVSANLPVPTLVNNVPKPRDASLALQDYCGNLGIVNDDSTIETLRIPVYAVDQAPKLIVPAQAAQADYHSLLDSGAAANLTAAYGIASGSYTLNGEDRLEVTQNTIAYCSGPNMDLDRITAAAKQVDATGVDRKNIVIISQATLSEMDVNYLLSISSSAQGAATPIVNFGGSNFSKNTIATTTYFVSLITTPISQALLTPAGGTVSAAPNAPVPPPPPAPAPAPALSGGPPAPMSLSALKLAKPPQAIVLPLAEFKASLAAASANQTITITRSK